MVVTNDSSYVVRLSSDPGEDGIGECIPEGEASWSGVAGMEETSLSENENCGSALHFDQAVCVCSKLIYKLNKSAMFTFCEYCITKQADNT